MTPLLTPETYDILCRLSTEWANEGAVVGRLAEETGRTQTEVRRRLTNLRNQALVERRRRQTIEPAWEIRKVQKP